MTYARAKAINADAIPVIDLAGSESGQNIKAVATALHAASSGLGFLYVKGHGIPSSVIDSARDHAYRFFRSPDAQKLQVKVSPQHRGWLGRGGAKMQDNAKADLKESFIWGFQSSDEALLDDHPLRGKNLWPDWVPELESSAIDFFHHSHKVARSLLQGFASGLNLPQDFFLQTADRPLSRASMVYYPAQPVSCGAEQFGVAPHTDFGMLTVLCQDDVGGLQIQDVNGAWIQAPPIPDTLVINVGDLLSRWTGGVYKSTPHRVVNSSGRERLSLVLAFDPNPETVIDVNDVFVNSTVSDQCVPDQMMTEPATTCGEYLVWRFSKAFAYRRDAAPEPGS